MTLKPAVALRLLGLYGLSIPGSYYYMTRVEGKTIFEAPVESLLVAVADTFLFGALMFTLCRPLPSIGSYCPWLWRASGRLLFMAVVSVLVVAGGGNLTEAIIDWSGEVPYYAGTQLAAGPPSVFRIVVAGGGATVVLVVVGVWARLATIAVVTDDGGVRGAVVGGCLLRNYGKKWHKRGGYLLGVSVGYMVMLVPGVGFALVFEEGAGLVFGVSLGFLADVYLCNTVVGGRRGAGEGWRPIG